MVVGTAFGRLKMRWTGSFGFSVNTVAACEILHNMCETFGDPFMEEWRTEESYHSITTANKQHYYN